ncbi:hypothetical protein GCM10010512_27570 [Streptomyces thermoviolaceus subsp. thermoviolaceus]|nr:hypothetical protein GCM10010499_28860 [Streptomyces thermoviolaceus subsp. apingens]GHA94501.1 hypothetical protein GCM10010512_27570 [Streptomyces thermoviolaceus subsp. thermoviolaceus]
MDAGPTSAGVSEFIGSSSLVLSGEDHSVRGGSGFPSSYAAPYVETWKPPSNMAEARRASGVKYFNLAFILDGGGCTAKFNGQTDVSDPQWISAINEDRAAGGDVIASFGGADGTELGVACKSADSLKAQYKRVIDTLQLTRVDFDIEGASLSDKASVDRRNEAIAGLQQEYAKAGKNLDVNYTLPVDPTGLPGNAVDLLKSARAHGVDVNLVNIMTMDYGPPEDMGDAAVKAANAVHQQLKQIWPQKSDSELWRMEGNTPMIGVNDIKSEVFSSDDAQTLTQFAREHGIQQLSFWALGRDQQCGSGGNSAADCSGVSQAKWQFSKEINGVTDASVSSPSPGDATSTPTHTPSAPAKSTGNPKPQQSTKPNAKPSARTSNPASTGSGPYHITGQVRCESGRPIVGVWVQTGTASDSRFAAWRGLGDGSTADWWTDLPKNERYSLHIGCGGTPASWASENMTGTYTGPHNSFDCNDLDGDPSRGTCTHRQ